MHFTRLRKHLCVPTSFSSSFPQLNLAFVQHFRFLLLTCIIPQVWSDLPQPRTLPLALSCSVTCSRACLHSFCPLSSLPHFPARSYVTAKLYFMPVCSSSKNCNPSSVLSLFCVVFHWCFFFPVSWICICRH